MAEGKEKKIEDSLNNVWLKNLFEKLEEKTEITNQVWIQKRKVTG